MTQLIRKPTVTELDRDVYHRELDRIRKTKGEIQLSFFNELAANTPVGYTNLFEFFDAIPKFMLTPHTSFRKGQSLEIKKFVFRWGDDNVHVSISPVVLESKAPKTGEPVRKEVLPGPREETVYRVLKKMAAETTTERKAKDRSVVIRFTLHQLRTRLADVGHEYKIGEIKEALQVLAQSPIKVRPERSKKELYSGTYISLQYVTDETDPTGQRSLVEVAFNELAAAAVATALYDRIHYERLMSLQSSLAQWIYELMTRNFRQAGANCGFKLSLSRILRESGLPPRSDLRANLRSVREALDELKEKGVVAIFPPVKEELQKEVRRGKGQRRIEEAVWTIFPSEDVTKDIKADNTAQAERRNRSQRPLKLATAAAGR